MEHLARFKRRAQDIVTANIQDLSPKAIIGEPRRNNEARRAWASLCHPHQSLPVSIREFTLADDNGS